MHRRLLAILCCVTLVLAVSAQTKHYVYIAAAGETAFLLDNNNLAKPKLGGGGNFGFGYELKHNRLLFHAGAEGEYVRYRSGVTDIETDYEGLDTQGLPFIWQHNFHNRIDQADVLNVNIPLQLGGFFNGVYFLVGPKLSLNLLGSSQGVAKVDAAGKYEGLLGPFQNMPNHSFYEDRSLAAPKHDVSFNFGVRIAAEVGYTFPHTDNQPRWLQYRLGAYAEYGLLNIHKNNILGELVGYRNVDEYPGVDFDLVYVYSSTESRDIRLNDLTVRVRFTLLFRMPSKKICVICND